MAIFRNLHTKTGSFSFNGNQLSFNGDFETSDESLISFFAQRQNWERIDREEAKEITQEEIAEESNESDEFEALKKEANDLGLKFHHRTGFDKLKELVEEAKKNG